MYRDQSINHRDSDTIPMLFSSCPSFPSLARRTHNSRPPMFFEVPFGKNPTIKVRLFFAANPIKV